MFHDDSLEDDLVVCLLKPFTTEEIPAFMAAAPFLSQLRQSMLARRWPEVRAVIKTRFLDGHVEQLARKLNLADPGLVAFLDANVDAVRRASRVLPSFRDRVFRAARLGDTHSYLYWKYSRDVLGKPAGLTKTALERQLGLGHFYVPVVFSFPCPNCCADAECEADGVGELAPDELRMQCRACGHVDHYRKYGDHALASHVLCGCSYCVAETQRAGSKLEQLQWDLVPGLVSYVRAEIASVASRAATIGQLNGDAQREVRDFAAQWAAREEGDFADALRAWVKRRHPRLFWPSAFLNQAWTLIDALATAGAVSVEVTYAADDDQEVLEDLVLHNAAWLTRDDEQRQRAEREQAKAMTLVLKGFELDKPGSLPEWLRAVSEVGLFDHCLILPCDIECRLYPERLALAAVSSASIPPLSRAQAPTSELQAAISLLRMHGYTIKAPQ